MNARASVVVFLLASSICALIGADQVQRSASAFSPVIPRTWNDQALASVELPLASMAVTTEHISSDYYYQMPVRPIYKSYAIYAPGKEPAGYFDELTQREPEIVFDPATLKTEADWIKAGELAFDAPIAYDADPIALASDAVWRAEPGVVPEGRCAAHQRWGDALCTLRDQEEGNRRSRQPRVCDVPHAGDGRWFSHQRGAGQLSIRSRNCVQPRAASQPQQQLEVERGIIQLLFGTPWLRPDPLAQIAQTSLDSLMSIYEAIPPGVLARHGSSPLHPCKCPISIGIKDRRYLDRTGLGSSSRHRRFDALWCAQPGC